MAARKPTTKPPMPVAPATPAEASPVRKVRKPRQAAAMVAPVSEPARVTPYPLLTPTDEPVSVVHIAAELAPFARTGGLGEAVANLALQQIRAGLTVSILMPKYQQVGDVVGDFVPASEPFSVQVGPRTEQAQLFESAALKARQAEGKPRVYFIGNAHYFDREGIYGDRYGDYGDNAQRWAFFALAALNALPMVAAPPVMMHVHDWHAALAPVYLRAYDTGKPFFRKTWSTLTVHNAGFQGHFPPATMADIGLPSDFYNYHMLEWYGKVNLLKGGLACADVVTTVSPTHAHELCTPAGGFGLHDMFVAMRDRFVGILNGIDNKDWDPATDAFIAANYSLTALGNKRKNKAALQNIFGLPQRPGTPIIGMSARMVAQKGLDLILGSPAFLSLDAQFIFLGQGEKKYVDILRELGALAQGRIGVQTNFTVEQEHRLLAGADMIVMPSQYEPCGLTQMRAQRYGTLPVARRVGGLADTIDDNVTGFLFDDYTQAAFISACARAIDHYRHPQVWTAMVKEAMARDFGWHRSEARYRELYRRAITAPRGRR
ncbi:MAG: glycogen synthase [Cytophagaceae bacterium]|nr:glycogen synthase [Gemmatimonadaceae bacterium]